MNHNPLHLYPLKFKPRFVEKPWGGHRIRDDFNYTGVPDALCGEVWLLSAVPGGESVVDNGPLKGNTLQEVYEIFMEELAGDKVYKEFPDRFPILIKILDANEWLSVQVHPDDTLAAERYRATGKTEMWYILDATPGAELISGFNRELDRDAMVFVTENGLLPEVLHHEPVSPGDAFFTPAGRIHAIGPGILLAEIQQTSDVTYRLYDWNRKDAHGNGRKTHLTEALAALDYTPVNQVKTTIIPQNNQANTLIECPQFQVSLIPFDTPLKNDFTNMNSFVALLFVRGDGMVISDRFVVPYTAGEVILLPANTAEAELLPSAPSEVLQIHIP